MKDLTAAGWLEALAEYLKTLEAGDGRLSAVVSFWNGFEGWLKFEMASLLVRSPWSYRPWIGTGPGDVGLEYRAQLAEGQEKLVDLWASPRPGADAWIFVELKTVFRNGNAAKQFESWRRDLEALWTIDRRFGDQRVSSVMSVIVGAGFTLKQFEEAADRASEGLANTTHHRMVIETKAEPVCVRALVTEYC